MDSVQYNPPADTTPVVVPAVEGLQYLALGDSYTIGEGVLESERFPAQIVKLLSSDQITIQKVQYIATSGWTTGNLTNAIASQNPPNNFDIVTLLIGVNDQYQQRDTAGYRARFAKLLHTAVTLAANRTNRVIVISIPDYIVTPFVHASQKAMVSAEIDAFNLINRQVTEEKRIVYIDITPRSREAATDMSLLANDGLHPSGKQYARWASLIAPAVKNGLK